MFPNVDQRLEMFLEKYSPYCKELRLSLTFYNQNRYYMVKRLDGEEIFGYLCWNGELTLNVIKKYKDRLQDSELETFKATDDSPYANGRQNILSETKRKYLKT